MKIITFVIPISFQQLPPPTQLIPDGKEFTIGDFMVLNSDADRDWEPIWRYLLLKHYNKLYLVVQCSPTRNFICISRLHSKTLVERYNPVSSGLYESVSTFWPFSAADRENYLSVAVEFVSSTKDRITVRVQKKEDRP